MNRKEEPDPEDLRLLVLNTLEPSPDARIARAVADGFAEVLGPNRVCLARYDNACATFHKARCNALLLLDGRGTHSAIVGELLRLSPWNVLWTSQPVGELPAALRRAAALEVFSSNRASPADFGGKARPLPLAARSSEEPVPLEQRCRDVFFAGTARPDRARFLRDLIPRLQGLKTQFLLPCRTRCKPDLPLPRCEWDVRIGFADELIAARYSKVVLHLDRNLDGGGPLRGARLPGGRLFETAALGVAQVAVCDEAAIGPYFEPGKEILLARGPEEAAAAIRQLLADPDRLEALGQAARTRALAHHRYAHRAREILAHMAVCRLSLRESSVQSNATFAERKAIVTIADLGRRNLSGTPGTSESTCLAWRVSEAPSTAANHPSAAPRQRPLRVLLVAHNVRGQRPWGGTELHVDQLCTALKNKYDIHLLYSSPHRSGPAMVHRHCGTARQRVLYRGPYDWYRSWVDPRRDAAFQKLLVEEEIDVVHFVHFLYNSLGYVEVARSLGRPTVLGLYDYFIACPQFNLLDTSGQFCNLPGAEACDRCLGRMDGLPAGAQARRRELLSRVCATADRIHFLCHSQRALIERVLPIPEDRAFVQGLGIRAAGGPQPAPPAPPPLQVAVLGNLAHNKGAETLISIIRRLPFQGIRFRIAGNVEKEYRAELETLSGGAVELLGPYEPEQVGSVLRGCHAALFTSPWPETFMLTLSEALSAGVVPVGPDLGVFPERVCNGENGLVVRGDPASYVRALVSLLENPALLARLQAGAGATRVLTHEEDAAGIQRLYEGLAADYGLPARRLPPPREPDGFAPIVTAAVGVPRNDCCATAKSLLRKAIRVYKTHGAQAVLRRARQRLSGGTALPDLRAGKEPSP